MDASECLGCPGWSFIMDNLAASFASLVKSNNGLFKSEKQAAFLLSVCQDAGTFYTGGQVYGNSYSLQYNCDDFGVVSVEKYLSKTGKIVLVWSRLTHTEFAAKQADKAAAKAEDAARQANAIERFQARADAFQLALKLAQECAKHDMMKAGISEERASRMASAVMADQDAIMDNLPGLQLCPKFAAAWSAFKSTPGV